MAKGLVAQCPCKCVFAARFFKYGSNHNAGLWGGLVGLILTTYLAGIALRYGVLKDSIRCWSMVAYSECWLFRGAGPRP